MWFTQSGSIYKARDTNDDGKADETVTVLAKGKLPEAAGTGGGRSASTTRASTPRWVTTGTSTAHARRRCASGGSTSTAAASELRRWSSQHREARLTGTDDLYGADHGSDNYGSKFGEGRGKQPVTDLNPPCEFNLYVEGGFYGHPYVVGNKLPRLEFMNRDGINLVDLADRTIAPAWPLGGHVAPNGWTFTTKDTTVGRPGDAIVARHGSWNSTKKVGYAVQHVMFDEETGKPYGARPLVVTLGKDGNDVMGRPCDVTERPTGRSSGRTIMIGRSTESRR